MLRAWVIDGYEGGLGGGGGSVLEIRPARSTEEVAQLNALRLHVLQNVEKRWRAGAVPQVGGDDLLGYGTSAVHLVAMVDGRCIGGVRLWVGDGSFDGFDLDVLEVPVVRAARLVICPEWTNSLCTLEANGESVRRVPLALALLLTSVAIGIHTFGIPRFVLTCLPAAASIYRKLGAVTIGEPFVHTSLHGDPQPPHPDRYIAMLYDHNAIHGQYTAGNGPRGLMSIAGRVFALAMESLG